MKDVFMDKFSGLK